MLATPGDSGGRRLPLATLGLSESDEGTRAASAVGGKSGAHSTRRESGVSSAVARSLRVSEKRAVGCRGARGRVQAATGLCESDRNLKATLANANSLHLN